MARLAGSRILRIVRPSTPARQSALRFALAAAAIVGSLVCDHWSVNLPANHPLYMTRWPGGLLAGAAALVLLWEAIPLREPRPAPDMARMLAWLGLPWCTLFLLLALWDGGRCSFPMNLFQGDACDQADDSGAAP